MGFGKMVSSEREAATFARGMHGLRSNATRRFISCAEEDADALGLRQPSRLRDFALFADRSAPVAAVPAKYALCADAEIPAGPAPSGFSLAADVKAVIPADRWSRRAFYAAIAIAVFLHLSFLAPFVLRPATSLKQLGMEEGLPENLSVSVVSEADLKRLSSDPFRQEARQAPSPANAPETAPAPEDAQVERDAPVPQPEVKEASAAPPPPSQPLFDDKPAPFDPSGFIAKAAQQFTSQIEYAMNAPEARREQPKRVARAAGNVTALRPGATHSGKSDAFERDVVWALAATKPMGNGKWGSVVVTFLINEAGRVEGLRLIKSSGDNWLDSGAMMSVKQAKLPVPPAGLTAGDRTFNVEYISIPN
jgi:periplasmic protein TonB